MVISGPASVIPKVWMTGTLKRLSISSISCGESAAATERMKRSGATPSRVRLFFA